MIAMTNSLLTVDLQNALNDEDNDKLPDAAKLKAWAQLSYAEVAKIPSEVTLRLVDEMEMSQLNSNYRGADGSTNVSFGPTLIGDVVLCHAVIQREACEQNKTLTNHYAHMVTHGVLHLCGYDHMDDKSAEKMEALEAKILAKSNIENPYT